MRGSVEKGLSELQAIHNSSTSMSFEAELLHHLTQGFILQQNDLAVKGIAEMVTVNPNQSLVLFLASILAVKNSESEKAIAYLKMLDESRTGLPISYAKYVLGEVMLHKADYEKAIIAYQQFVKIYTGRNYIKDALYKTGICYWLNEDKKHAIAYFDLARKSGNESTEADKYAARNLAENTFPNPSLSRIRYATDGGFYEEAFRLVNAIIPQDLSTLKDQTEFAYRKARLYHKTNRNTEAKRLYLETIELNEENPWYFAPNACLQLGYILQDEQNYLDALAYFEMALTYKRHEYKNSIDSKAKSAIIEKIKKEQNSH
jgi:tetratricopeptide (TPR) repeat protein